MTIEVDELRGLLKKISNLGDLNSGLRLIVLRILEVNFPAAPQIWMTNAATEVVKALHHSIETTQEKT